MARITFFGDFKANAVKRLNLSAELTYLLNISDVNVVNFEAPVQTDNKAAKKSGPNICQYVETPDWLEERGFNAVSLANNHTMDYGEGGLRATKQAFRHATMMGAGSWDEAYKLHVFTTPDRLNIGILCCTHCEFGTLTDPWKKPQSGCAWSLSSEIEKAICKRGGVKCLDALVVYNHGGVEYLDVPLPEWRERYRLWIDLGADAVIASHPHVPQGYELYHGKPICYSLGNFCFDTQKKAVPPHWYESLCCILEMEKPHEVKLQIRPIVYDHVNGYIKDNTSEEFAAHWKRINQLLQDDEAYMKEVNQAVCRLFPHYQGQFSRGGMLTGVFQKGLLKGIAEGFMGRGFFNYRHSLNNIQCESHRWAILRAMK